METVTIELPASIYVKLYNMFGESTREEIVNILSCSELDDALDSTEDNPATSQLPSYRPGPDTITGRVWEIADQLKRDNGVAKREIVVRACMGEGINMNTASTQFSQWKKENG